MKTVMGHTFSQIPRADIPRASFDRSCGYKTTFDAGLLIPVFLDEALPGDTFNLNMTAFARLATPLKPVMDNMYLSTFFFFVPERLVWDNWERFNGQQDDPDDTTDFVMPQIESPVIAAGGYHVGTIYDYFGLPTGIDWFKHRAGPLRAYNLIWNEWFRNENLQDSVAVPKTDGPDLNSLYTLLRRGKRHDYFTSCLPWPQKGPAVVLPLSGDAPVKGIGKENQTANANLNAYETGGSGTTNYPFGYFTNDSTPNRYIIKQSAASGGYPEIFADLSEVAAATINELRQAFQVQRLYERDARGGTRYTEIIRAHFGVVSPDARLQRPEFLGGGRTPVNVSPVVQTSGVLNEDPDTTPQGNLAAFGTVHVNRHGFVKSFTEHGYVIGLLCVDADLTYQEGLDRMWSRRTRFDFYWPALSHLGEQAVLSKEIFMNGGGATGSADDNTVFGYQEAFAEYRYKPSKITGEFRSNFAQSLDVWHLSEDFATRPTLSDTFMQSNPPIDRVIAVEDEPHFLLDAHFAVRCARPMPLYSVPGLIDHF